jgi:hypothetical protein
MVPLRGVRFGYRFVLAVVASGGWGGGGALAGWLRNDVKIPFSDLPDLLNPHC